jgi:hypothetical protein
MRTYVVEIKETYKYTVLVESNSKKEAYEMVKEAYENVLDTDWNGVFCADAISFEKAVFKVL